MERSNQNDRSNPSHWISHPILTGMSLRRDTNQTSQQPQAAPATDPSMLEMHQLDANTHHILPEEAWYGAELHKRAPKGQVLPEDPWGTGAFTMLGPDLESEPRLQGKSAQVLTHPTSSKELVEYMANEQKKRETAAAKASQLIRNGLVTHNTLTPILALPPNLTTKGQKRRRTVAAAQVEKYEYESSGDEVEDYWMRRQSTPRVKFAKLKQALERHEQPPQPKVVKPATRGTRKSLKRKAAETTGLNDSEEQQPAKRSKPDEAQATTEAHQATLETMPDFDAADQLGPSLEFQRAMRDPSHPDYGLSFSTPVELAIANEKEAKTLVATHDHWAADESDAEAPNQDAAAGPIVEDAAEGAVENAEGSAVKNSPEEAVVAAGEGATKHAAGAALQNTAEAAIEPTAKTALEADTETAIGAIARRSARLAAKQTKQTDLPGPPSGPESIPPNTKQAEESTTPAIPVQTPSQQQPAAAPLPLPLPAPAPAPPQQPAAASPPAAGPGPLRITRIFVQPKYEIFSFRTAKIIRERGGSFEQMAMVAEYNRVCRGGFPADRTGASRVCSKSRT